MTARSVAAAAVVVATLGGSYAFALDPDLRRQAKDPDPFRRCDAARSLGREGSADAAQLLAGLFEDLSPHVRDASVLACSELATPEAVEAIAAAARSKDELTRRNAATALGRTRPPGRAAALPHLEKLARKDPSPRVRADALDALWRFERDPAALDVAASAAADPDAAVRAAAVEAAGRIGGPGAADVARRATADPDDGVRCVGMLELRFIARDVALAGLQLAAKDPSWRVRAQAVDDAAWLREAPAVDALVTLVGDAVPRVADAAHRALRQLAEKDLGRDRDLWQAWWDAARPTWTAPQGKLADPDGADGGTRAAARYHGIDVRTGRAAFVIDFSGSMRDPITAGDPKSRADVARAELLRTLADLPDGFLANVVLFRSTPVSCFERATAMSAKTRADVAAFVQRTNPVERGDLLAGVLAALDDDGIDTLFLLSDGTPSAGDFVDRVRVQAAIRQVTRRRKVVVHTVGFGATHAAQRAFLEGVARDSGGRSQLR